MELISVIGAGIVTLALIAYSIAIITEQRKKKVTYTVINFLPLGVFLDVTATICMIIGSSNTPFTLHGFIGYSALLAMLIDMYLIVRLYRKKGINATVPRGIHQYSRYAYFWWVLAYISGSLLAMT